MKQKRELDIYVDETGDESAFSVDNPLYIVSFVCVETANDNKASIESFMNKLSKLNGGDHFVHTGNLVRKEKPYKNLLMEDRQKLFGAIFFFARKVKFSYFNAVIDKKVHQDKSLYERITDCLIKTIHIYEDYFGKFSKIRIHYDGGQAFLKGVFITSTKYAFSNGEYVQTRQAESPFMQLADMVGFMELIWYKANQGRLTKSDEKFFGKKRKIYKDYIKFLDTRKF